MKIQWNHRAKIDSGYIWKPAGKMQTWHDNWEFFFFFQSYLPFILSVCNIPSGICRLLMPLICHYMWPPHFALRTCHCGEMQFRGWSTWLVKCPGVLRQVLLLQRCHICYMALQHKQLMSPGRLKNIHKLYARTCLSLWKPWRHEPSWQKKVQENESCLVQIMLIKHLSSANAPKENLFFFTPALQRRWLPQCRLATRALHQNKHTQIPSFSDSQLSLL